MKVIKDGTISGNLPNNNNKNNNNNFGVYYPGYPSSINRAIQTLGGIQSIIKARSNPSNNLKLHFRPEDPYSHPAFGERTPCNNFLLKISKKKKDSNREESDNVNGNTQSLSEEKECQSEAATDVTDDKSQLSEEGEHDLCADIIAQVSDAYHFNGMVDYQHVIPIHADIDRKKKRTWEDMESQFDNDQDDLLMLVPPLFSMKNVPEKVVLKPSATLCSKKKQEGVVQQWWEMDIEPCLAIDFFIENVPKKIDWEKEVPKGSHQWVCQTAVCKLFEERPIWVKSSIGERLLEQGLECGDLMLRRLLFRAAYYFSNGPFLRLYIRKGYDPRKDPESRIYQRIDFRVPPALRSYCDSQVGSGLKHRWKDICSFRVFPYKCQISLQLFELSDDYIQKEIKKPPQLETCSLATGWFTPSTLHRLRLCVAVRFIKVYPQTGAESVLKSVSERFEKSKRILIFPKDPKPGEQQQQVSEGEKTQELNEEPVDSQEQEELNIDFEDEEVIDGENAEEEFDPYEDSSFSRQPSSYEDEENISRSYLQELFGTFPSSELQGADNSEEYEIYEPDDDNDDANVSDDDFD